MGVFIAKNLHKEKRFFNINGDEINPETHEVIKPKEVLRTPTPEQLAKMEEKLKKQAEMEEKGIKPETWKDIVK